MEPKNADRSRSAFSAMARDFNSIHTFDPGASTKPRTSGFSPASIKLALFTRYLFILTYHFLLRAYKDFKEIEVKETVRFMIHVFIRGTEALGNPDGCQPNSKCRM